MEKRVLFGFLCMVFLIGIIGNTSALGVGGGMGFDLCIGDFCFDNNETDGDNGEDSCFGDCDSEDLTGDNEGDNEDDDKNDEGSGNNGDGEEDIGQDGVNYGNDYEPEDEQKKSINQIEKIDLRSKNSEKIEKSKGKEDNLLFIFSLSVTPFLIILSGWGLIKNPKILKRLTSQ
jgi:hypothetical protein